MTGWAPAFPVCIKCWTSCFHCPAAFKSKCMCDCQSASVGSVENLQRKRVFLRKSFGNLKVKRCDSIGCRNLSHKILNVSFFDVKKHDSGFPMPNMIHMLIVGMPVA